MKKDQYTHRHAGRLFSLLFLCLAPFLLWSQRAGHPKELWGDAAARQLPGAGFFKEKPGTPFPAFVRFQAPDRKPLPSFFSWLKQTVKSNNDLDFTPFGFESDNLGFTHYRFIQTFRGIPIENTLYILHVKDNLVHSFNGYASNENAAPAARARLNEATALQAALRIVGAVRYKWQDNNWENRIKRQTKNPAATYFPKGELFWLNTKNGLVLSYRFDIHAASPDRFERLYVDAGSGELLSRVPMESNCDAATVNTIFNGNQNISTDKYTSTNWRLRDDCQSAVIHIRNWNSTTCTASAQEIENSTNTWNNTNNERFGGTVLWSTKQAFLYWQNVRGRNSYDNAGGDVVGYINAVFDSDNSTSGCEAYTDNASMSFTGGTLKVGLGSSGTLANSWSTVDILGHEFTHAVTGATAQLVYQNESGALNESFSDIFGEATENFVSGTNDWLVGKQRTSGAIRSMSNPNTYGDPDTYLGTNWFTGSGDNGGVHTNSGVQNYWFYLLTAGGSGTNDNGDAFNVSGIGLADASAIAARNLTVYLTKNDGYSEARTNAIQAAIDLFGACSNQVKQTTNAWHAVGVGDAFFDAAAVVTSNYNGRDVSCFNACDGSATVNVTSGNNPTYQWSNGANTQSISGLCPGTYTVKVTNDNGTGCSVTRSVTINNTPQLLINPVATSNYNGYNVSCNGGNNGRADAQPSGGTPPYTYAWDDGETTNPATQLKAGNHSVTVTDANGCKATGNVSLTEPPPLTIDAGDNKIVYYGYPDSACTKLTATGIGGGVPPYTVSWSDGTSGSTTTVCPTATAVYTVTVTDANGCSASDKVTVCVIDVRCGHNLDKVTICHRTNSASNPNETLCISVSAARSHFRTHPGDQLAACGTVKVCTDAMMVFSESRKYPTPVPENIGGTGYLKAQPNPFNASTTVRFTIGKTDRVYVKLFDLLGREHRTLFTGVVDANKIYQVNLNGSELSKGVYFLRLTTDSGDSYVEKLVIAR